MCFTDWRQLPMLTDVLQAGGFVWRGVMPWDKTESSRAPHTGYFRHQCEYVVWGPRWRAWPKGMPNCSSLGQAEQATVWLRIIEGAGTDRPSASLLAKRLGTVGRRLLLVSVAIGLYEVYEAEDKPREIARQGTLVTAGAVGGWAVGAGAVGIGVCAAAAPVCVGSAALIGGILVAFGSDLAFGTFYPRPVRR
jgi:hypothetical protein